MGKVAGKLLVKGDMGGLVKPQPTQSLQPLVGWPRENLIDTFQTLRQEEDSYTLHLWSFIRLFGLGEDEGKAAFADLGPNKKELVDFLVIFAPMVATSDQSYISRVSLLFSIFDLDSSGSINRAEFFIALRGLVLGLSRLYKTPALSPTEMEEVTREIFDKVDADKSGVITLGEVLNFAYRSKEFKDFLGAFPSEDGRIFEDLLQFPRSDNLMVSAIDPMVQQAEVRLRDRLTISPQPNRIQVKRKEQQSAFKRPGKARPVRTMGKAQALVMYNVFLALSKGSTCIVAADLQEFLQEKLPDKTALPAMLKEICQQAQQAVEGTGEANESEESKDTTKLQAHLVAYFSDRQAIARLCSMTDGKISLRAFFCLAMLSATEAEIDQGLRYCLLFRAQGIMRELAENEVAIKLDKDDIEALFQAMDVDGDGRLSEAELAASGNLEGNTVKKLMSRWDKDGDGELTKDEMQSILFQMDASLKLGIKARIGLQHMLSAPSSLPFLPEGTS